MKIEQGKTVAEIWQGKRQARRLLTPKGFSLTPLMDVMFNLLIFFLVAASFKLPEGLLAARLPRSSGLGESAAIPLVPIRILLEPAERDARPIIRVSSTLRSDVTALRVLSGFDELYQHLAALRQQPGVTEQTPVILAVRKNTNWDQVVDAYNAALRAKYEQIVFAAW